MSRVIYFNTCIIIIRKKYLLKCIKNLLKKGKNWELYDKDEYKECQNAIVFGSTKNIQKLWKIQNKSQN